MKPCILKTEKQYQEALKQIEILMSARAGSAKAEELDLWVFLVTTYENQHYPVDTPDPLAAINFRMEQQGLRAADLIPYIGSKSKVSEVLAGKRALSITMIRKLHEGLGIPAEVLIQKKAPIKCRKSSSQQKYSGKEL